MSKRRREPIAIRQLPLDLRARTHGGARPGAGRPRRKEVDRTAEGHRMRPSHRKDDPVHITIRVLKRMPSMRSQLLAAAVKRCFLEQRKALEKKGAKHFQVVHFSIQDDHLHIVVEASDRRGLARGVMGLEIRLARRLNALLKRSGRFWKDRYHRRDLRSPIETRNVLRYVLLNAQKHHRSAAGRSEADRESSASTFDGFTRPPRIFDDDLRWPWLEPRTWLLRVGWKRRGLIDPAETPPSSPYRSPPP